jgi:FMN phosphatase YigB (HAD superfamily)
MEEAYWRALTLVGEDVPNQCVLFEDSARNLCPASALGMYTVLVGKKKSDPAARLCVSSLSALPTVMPDLWEGYLG